MSLMRKLMLNFCHFWIHDLVRVKVTGVEPPMARIAPSLDLSPAVAPDLAYDVLAVAQVWAPPIILQLPGGLLVMEMSLDYGNWMVLIQVGWTKGGQALMVQYVFQWWLGQSATDHHPGLLVWHWVELACHHSQCVLIRWMWHHMSHPSSVFLLMITACRRGWPNLGQSIQVLLGQLCHLKPYLPQLVPAMHEVVVVSLCHSQWRLPVFPNNTKSQASQVLVSLLETGMGNVMGCFQMPHDLLDHFSCLVEWGCGLQSGYWFQVSDHLGHLIL